MDKDTSSELFRIYGKIDQLAEYVLTLQLIVKQHRKRIIKLEQNNEG